MIAKVIEQDPFIFDKALAEQFRKLLLQPLQDQSLHGSHPSTMVVVVDALDECKSGSDIRTILKLWSQLTQIPSINLRLFLTGRPELPIQLGFKKLSTDTYQDMVLQDAVPRNTIEHDLLMYLRHAFTTIREECNDRIVSGVELNSDWPGSDVLNSLVSMAVPLFIVVATVCRFVGDLEFDPAERLEKVLASGSTGQMTQMETTYLPVLSYLCIPTRDKTEKQELCEEFRIIVGCIICLAEPLSVVNIGLLLDKSTESIERRLGSLHSVLQVPNDRHSPVRTLHLSFAEFLLSEKSQKHAFGINGPVTHLTLLQCCLRLLSGFGGLRENICNLDSPGRLRREVDRATVEESISTALQYACRYWVLHCQNSATLIKDNDIVHTFLRQHILHWLEALSFMDRLYEAVGHLSILLSLTAVSYFHE